MTPLMRSVALCAVLLPVLVVGQARAVETETDSVARLPVSTVAPAQSPEQDALQQGLAFSGEGEPVPERTTHESAIELATIAPVRGISATSESPRANAPIETLTEYEQRIQAMLDAVARLPMEQRWCAVWTAWREGRFDPATWVMDTDGTPSVGAYQVKPQYWGAVPSTIDGQTQQFGAIVANEGYWPWRGCA